MEPRETPQHQAVKVLVTGSRGSVGTQVVADLSRSGHATVGYDVVDSQDIFDLPSLQKATRECDAIIHSAALLGRPEESAERIMSVNLLGTWNVLAAAAEARVGRIVFISSVNALGIFCGDRPPDYLPIDKAHPCYPSTPYGISKRLGEEMCRFFSADTGIPVICLRPPAIWTNETYATIQAERAKRPEFEWDPFWEYGAFIDVRDLSQACLSALSCKTEGFHCVLVASSDISTSGKSGRELAEQILPGIEWRGGEEYESDPYRSLIDITEARRLLGWEPQHTWQAFLSEGA